MLRRDFIGFASVASNAAALLPRFQPSLPLESFMRRPSSEYADINGLQLYYEVHGEGQPIILLHGGVSASEVFGQVLPELAKTRKVLAVHLQGHGHTKDINRALRFRVHGRRYSCPARISENIQSRCVGLFLGGGIALQATIRHPAVVNRLVVISAAMKHDGSFPEVNAAFDQMNAHASQIAPNIKGSPLGQMYPEVNWESLLRKIAEMESRRLRLVRGHKADQISNNARLCRFRFGPAGTHRGVL